MILCLFSAEPPSQGASEETHFFNTTRATTRNLLAGFLAQPRPPGRWYNCLLLCEWSWFGHLHNYVYWVVAHVHGFQTHIKWAPSSSTRERYKGLMVCRNFGRLRSNWKGWNYLKHVLGPHHAITRSQNNQFSLQGWSEFSEGTSAKSILGVEIKKLGNEIFLTCREDKNVLDCLPCPLTERLRTTFLKMIFIFFELFFSHFLLAQH
jgi:hypothetical protein